ncbi:MAG: hypothetical protein ABI686_06425, partial [Acidobacteriota bacterium]
TAFPITNAVKIHIFGECEKNKRTSSGKAIMPATALDHLFSSVIYRKGYFNFLSRNFSSFLQ